MKRPAEASAVASATALLIARVAGVNDVDTVTALAIVIGFVPAAVTWTVCTFGGNDEARKP